MSVYVDDPKLVYRRTLLFYALTTIPLTGMGTFFTNYFFIYATDVLLIAPAVMGTLMAVTRIYDGVSDIVIATWSDRSESKRGRRRPFILVGGLMCVLLWTNLLVPTSLGPTGTVIWLLFSMLWVQTAMTLRAIPIRALGIESGTTPKQRTFFGILIPFLTIPVVVAVNFLGQSVINSPDPRATIAPYIIGVGILTAVLSIIFYPLLKELPLRSSTVERNVWKMMKEVLGVGYHRQLIGVQFAESFAFTSLAFSVPYMMRYVIDRPEMIAVIFVTYLVVQRITGFGWYKLIPRWGMREIWRKGLCLWLVVFAGVPFVIWGGFPLYLGLAILAGIAGGAASVNFAMLGDIADYDSKHSGRQRQGIYMTIYRLVGNVGGAITGFALGWLLQFSGFTPNVEQSSTTMAAIIASSSILPIVGVLIGLRILSRYRLYELEGVSDGRIPAEDRSAPPETGTAPA